MKPQFRRPGFASLRRRGVRDCTPALSDDGATFSTVLSGRLTRGMGQPLAAQDFAVAATGRYVAPNILNDHAFADFVADDTGSGLSEVRLNIAAVPQPAAWAMPVGGIGLVGGTLRRRGDRAVAALA